MHFHVVSAGNQHPYLLKSRYGKVRTVCCKHITKGTRIIQYIGRRISKEETAERLYQGNQYIFAFNDRYNIDGKTLKNKARYINHSCDPNCEVLITQRTIWIVAKRDIQAGEELSYNYGFTAKQYRCTCGAHNCCGYILGEEYWHS